MYLHFVGISQSCGYDQIIKKNTHKVNFINKYEMVYDHANGLMSNNNETYHIPVVFHVVYNTEEQNIPDSVIISQIDVLTIV